MAFVIENRAGSTPRREVSSSSPPMLMDRMREALRSRHYARRTEKTYRHWVKAIHSAHLASGWGRVQLPNALDRKYPNAPVDWRWHWVFPQENRWKNLRTGEEGRHHVLDRGDRGVLRVQ